MFFAADEAGYGNELWATDGSLTGTYLVKDISPWYEFYCSF
ncbi:MAG: hypothetical protein IPG79_21725 [Saprospiraceae bacterium]|nr:hypothetical protein [Saprospiraceae bacterium]